MRAVKCGIGSVIPLETLSIFTASDLDLRVCGIPDVDLKYLKVRGGENGSNRRKRMVNVLCIIVYRFGTHFTAYISLSLCLSLSDSHYISCWSNGNRQTHPVLLDSTRDTITGNRLVT